MLLQNLYRGHMLHGSREVWGQTTRLLLFRPEYSHPQKARPQQTAQEAVRRRQCDESFGVLFSNPSKSRISVSSLASASVSAGCDLASSFLMSLFIA